ESGQDRDGGGRLEPPRDRWGVWVWYRVIGHGDSARRRRARGRRTSGRGGYSRPPAPFPPRRRGAGAKSTRQRGILVTLNAGGNDEHRRTVPGRARRPGRGAGSGRRLLRVANRPRDRK